MKPVNYRFLAPVFFGLVVAACSGEQGLSKSGSTASNPSSAQSVTGTSAAALALPEAGWKPEKKSVSAVEVKPAVPSLNSNDIVASIHVDNRIQTVNARQFLISALKPNQVLRPIDRMAALANLALTASLDADSLESHHYESAPRYRVMHMLFTFLVPFQKTAHDTPEVLYRRLVDHWKDQCAEEGLKPEKCSFVFSFDESDWMTPLPDFYSPVSKVQSEQKAVDDAYGMARENDPLMFPGEYKDHIQDALKKEDQIISSVTDYLNEKYASVLQVDDSNLEEEVDPEAAFQQVLHLFLSANLPPELVSEHERFFDRYKSQTIQSGKFDAKNVADYIHSKKFIALSTSEELIRQAQVSSMKRSYTWVYDENGTDLRSPYGDSVASVLSPSWVEEHRETPFPKGKLYLQKPSGPGNFSPNISDFIENPWPAISFQTSKVPADFNAFWDLIQERLDLEYVSMKRRDVLGGVQYGAKLKSAGLAPPSYRAQALSMSPLIHRSARFGLIRVAKGKNLDKEIRKLGGAISPADPAKAQEAFASGVQQLGLKSAVSYREYSGEFSSIYKNLDHTLSLDSVLKGRVFRREVEGIKDASWVGDPHAPFVDPQTGDTIYVLMLEEHELGHRDVQEGDLNIDKQILWDKGAALYARNELMKSLTQRLKEVFIEVLRPDVVYGEGSTRLEPPSVMELMDAVQSQLQDLETQYTDEQAWNVYSSGLSKIPLRPKDFVDLKPDSKRRSF